MGSDTRPSDHLRLVQAQTHASALSQSDFAWEILRRRADYQAGPAPSRWTIGKTGGERVTLIEGTPPADRSWGLLFRGGPATRSA
jgi:hypothetical protein